MIKRQISSKQTWTSIVKRKTLVLKTTTWWTRASHFVDGWHLLRCQILFFPTPYVVDHLTFEAEGEISLGKNFFPTSEVRNFFPWHVTVQDFFSSWAIFVFQWRIPDIIFPRYFLASFLPSKSVCWILLSQIVGGQNPLNICSVDRPWLANHFQNLLKQQETKRSKEERNSFLRNSTRRVRTDVRTYGNVITKFSRMDSLQNFLRYGALLNGLSQYNPPPEVISRYLELIRLSLRQTAE